MPLFTSNTMHRAVPRPAQCFACTSPVPFWSIGPVVSTLATGRGWRQPVFLLIAAVLVFP